ncbi:Snf7 family [Sesbania bispinosa]|nr:Snf7 family [Sesbania bispinosa]
MTLWDQIQTLKSTQAMGDAMKGVTKAMGQMNRQMNLPSLQRIMQEFERQNEKMELVSEVMEDAIDDALEGDEEEEETEDLVNQVLDEIGIDINSELLNAPSSTSVTAPAAKNRVAQAESTGNDESGIDDDLQARGGVVMNKRIFSNLRVNNDHNHLIISHYPIWGNYFVNLSSAQRAARMRAKPLINARSSSSLYKNVTECDSKLWQTENLSSKDKPAVGGDGMRYISSYAKKAMQRKMEYAEILKKCRAMIRLTITMSSTRTNSVSTKLEQETCCIVQNKIR